MSGVKTMAKIESSDIVIKDKPFSSDVVKDQIIIAGIKITLDGQIFVYVYDKSVRVFVEKGY